MRVFLLLVLGVVAWADEPAQVSKVIEVKHADVSRIAAIVGNLGVAAKPDPALRVIAIRGFKEQVGSAEEAIHRLDVPPPVMANLEVTVFMVLASSQAGGGDLDAPELGAVTKQLRTVFPYKSYRLAESFVVRTRDGESGLAQGTAPSIDKYEFKFSSTSLSAGEKGRMVRLNNLMFHAGHSMIQTSVDVREGQKAVVGKSSGRTAEDALFLVIMAKVVE